MKTGYQIYKKHEYESAFSSAGDINWFWKEEDAIARCKALNDTWNEYGIKYIVVKLG